MPKCTCISCLGAPDSGTECKNFDYNLAGRRARTARNEEMLAETGRNFE